MDKVVVIDFDECFCSVNSFRYWIVFSFFILLVTLRLHALTVFSHVVLERFRGRVDRVDMKRGVLSVTEDLPKWAVALFCQFLQLFTNSTVSRMISSDRFEGASVVLCTAAPACYVEPFAKRFVFSHVFATSSVKCEGWKENFGVQKMNSLTEHYGNDMTIFAVVTDHHDDLPILEKAELRYIVRPTAATLQALNNRFDYEVIS